MVRGKKSKQVLAFVVKFVISIFLYSTTASSGIETPSDVAVKSDTSDWNFSFKNITELPWEKLLDLILKCMSIFGTYFSKEAPTAPSPSPPTITNPGLVYNGPVFNGPIYILGPIDGPVYIGLIQPTKTHSMANQFLEPEIVTKTEAVFPGHTSVANPLRTTTIQPTVTKRADL